MKCAAEFLMGFKWSRRYPKPFVSRLSSSFRAQLILRTEMIPGLGPLINKITDSINGEPFGVKIMNLLNKQPPVFVFTTLEVNGFELFWLVVFDVLQLALLEAHPQVSNWWTVSRLW